MKKLIMKVKVFGSLSALLLIAVAVLATSVENESDNPAIVSDELIQTSNMSLSPVQLTKEENNNIQVFKNVSPSVVFVTNTQLRR